MEQHPIPRQITSFEFKLVGFLTLKQFIYVALFAALGFVVYLIFPVPILNIFLGLLVGGAGLAFAFLPVNDRPLEVWIRNLYKRLMSPTQYSYNKNNPPIYFLQNLYFVSDPHRILSHIESQEKLSQYLAKTSPYVSNAKKQTVNNLLHASTLPQQPARKTDSKIPKNQLTSLTQPIPQSTTPSSVKTPFFSGLVKNHKLIPIPGVLLYVKDEKGTVLRLLKTNPHGIFATFNPLIPNNYIFEIKDPKNTYFFDTIKVKIEANNPKPIEFYSKELL